MANSAYYRIDTWPRFRYLRRSWKNTDPWIFNPLISDAEAVEQGYSCGGQGRNARSLPIAERSQLFELLVNRHSLGDEDERRLRTLLGRVPFAGPIGIIDLDVNTESPEYEFEASRALARDYATRFAANASRFGLGNPNWYTSNELGGFHADLVAPEGVESIHLVQATRELVKVAAHELGIPLLSNLPGKKYKTTRPAVYIDDTGLNRFAEASGSVWRLPGTSKPGGAPKTLFKMTDLPYQPMDSTTLLAAVKQIEERTVPAESVEGRPEPATPRAFVGSSLQPEDVEFINVNPSVKSVFTEIKVIDRSKRDYRITLQAKRAGASDTQALRIMHLMPGSKYAEDHRGNGYDRSILSSVYRNLRWNPDSYEGFLKPFRFSDTERATIAAAVKMASNHYIANKLTATLGCGELHTQSAFDGHGLSEVKEIHRCERSTCSWCEPRRIYLQITHVVETWAERVYVFTEDLDDESPSACQRAISRLTRRLERKGGRKPLSRARLFRAPGRYVVVTTTPKALAFGAVEMTKSECLELIKDTLYRRFNRFLGYVQAGDSEGLANDLWCGHVVTVTGGKKANGLPWLDKENLRDKAKPPKPEGVSVSRKLVASRTGKVMAEGATISRKEINKARREIDREILENQKPPD